MPFVQASPDVRIYYHVYKSSHNHQKHDSSNSDHAQSQRILLIMGLGASFLCWKPQIYSLIERSQRYGVDLELCTLDNRGLGLSSAPRATSANYSTRCAHNHTLPHAATHQSVSWPATASP